MKKQTKKNHFSPVFANKYWTSEENGWVYSYYYYSKNRKKVVKANRDKGKTAWGYKKNLYSQEIEDRFDKELENESAQLYEKLVDGILLNTDERMKWGQYIISQALRVPSFLKYYDKLLEIGDYDSSYKDIVIGCPSCHENKYIACRNWLILNAAEDDFFVRTDNPVYMTGFIENPSTTIFYPLTPKKCFVACSMLERMVVLKGEKIPYPKQDFLKLEKGDAYYMNFEFIKSANTSLILATTDDNTAINALSLDVLGNYPQIPFLLSSATNDYESLEKQQALTNFMRLVDGIFYPSYRKYPFKPFYGIEFSMGRNPFSIFGATDDRLPELKDNLN